MANRQAGVVIDHHSGTVTAAGEPDKDWEHAPAERRQLGEEYDRHAASLARHPHGYRA
ncbi:hypothetical protein [Streptomyces hygroscopicus]|uniref:hypothetical protein n=1 Tax=Streptomyces hygroscopicus TaxID=1912 RepID=UPI0022401E1D|nr:hypothetical protein [Streptomyces hygroscopicus]